MLPFRPSHPSEGSHSCLYTGIACTLGVRRLQCRRLSVVKQGPNQLLPEFFVSPLPVAALRLPSTDTPPRLDSPSTNALLRLCSLTLVNTHISKPWVVVFAFPLLSDTVPPRNASAFYHISAAKSRPRWLGTLRISVCCLRSPRNLSALLDNEL